jgi:hypothetical protein
VVEKVRKFSDDSCGTIKWRKGSGYIVHLVIFFDWKCPTRVFNDLLLGHQIRPKIYIYAYTYMSGSRHRIALGNPLVE